MLISFIRTIIIYVFIMIAIRILGKRQVSQLQTSELVATLLISDIAVIPMQDSGQPLSSGIVPIMILVALELIISVVMLKNIKFRKLICGKPVLIINNGVLLQEEMKELRISIEDLFEELRENGVFSINEVKFAVMETNGSLSIMKKEEYDTINASDLRLNKKETSLDVVVVSDGDICKDSLAICEKDEKWLSEIIEKNGKKVSDIFIMTANSLGNYTIIEREV